MEHPVLALDRLYQSFEEHGDFDQSSVQGMFDCLHSTLCGAGFGNPDMVIEIVCDICAESQKIGFLAGVKAGVCLQQELS